jgi:hypothetical protein
LPSISYSSPEPAFERVSGVGIGSTSVVMAAEKGEVAELFWITWVDLRSGSVCRETTTG